MIERTNVTLVFIYISVWTILLSRLHISDFSESIFRTTKDKDINYSDYIYNIPIISRAIR